MEDYLSKTLVDAGKEILKNQLHVYAEAEDEEMIHVISEMINDDNACYDIIKRLILKVSENDDIVFESLSLTMDNFIAKKAMKEPEELQYFKDVQKACKMADEFSKSENQNTGCQEFEEILKDNGIEVTVRREMGTDINAACGQLRRSYLEENK